MLLIVSCFFNWTWYPDLQKFFTGFFTEKNYYGRPGILLSILAGLGILLYNIRKDWANRLNLIFAGIAIAYAGTSFLRYTSSYDGFVPEKQAGIYLMISMAFLHLVTTVLINSVTRVSVERNNREQSPETV